MHLAVLGYLIVYILPMIASSGAGAVPQARFGELSSFNLIRTTDVVSAHRHTLRLIYWNILELSHQLNGLALKLFHSIPSAQIMPKPASGTATVNTLSSASL